MVKFKKKKNKQKFNKLQQSIFNHTNDIIISNNYTHTSINLNTNINVNKLISSNHNVNKSLQLNYESLKNDPIKTIKYVLYPTIKQKKIFHQWFNAYIDMFNDIIFYIKHNFKTALQLNPKLNLVDFKIDLNITKLKKIFASRKNQLATLYNINLHILDYAINDAIVMYKSKISNLINGYIKKSRLRYLKKSKNNKIFKVEKFLWKSNTFCPSIIGQSVNVKPKIDFKKEIETVAIIQYNKVKNKYYLLVRKEIIDNNTYTDKFTNLYNKTIDDCNKITGTSKEFTKIINSLNKSNKSNFDIDCIKQSNKQLDSIKRKMTSNKKYQNKVNIKDKLTNAKHKIAFDPGIRTFLTGISDDHILEIGTNMMNIIKKKLKSIDNINNYENLSNKIPKMKIRKMNDKTKRKITNKIENRIKNIVNDYQWKIINYITNKYSYICIGNFSTKQMGESDTLKMIKRIGSRLRFYEFKQRLRYKCFLKGVKYNEVDEYCTSKCCSKCANFNKNLGTSIIYKCTKCNLKIGRDINAAKNIYIKSIK